MAKSQLEDLLANINLALAEELLARVKSGEADASTLNAARQYLKDNGITSTPDANPAAKELSSKLNDVSIDTPEALRFRHG